MLNILSKIRQRFVLSSFSMVIVVVVVLVMSGGVFFFLSNALEDFIQKQIVDPVQAQTQNHALLELKPEDWKNWRSPESVDRFMRFFLLLNLNSDIVRTNLFNTESVLIWSSYPSEIGMVVEKAAVDVAIESDKKVVETANPEGTTAKAFGIKNLLEIYVPVHAKTGEIVGVAEVYFDNTELIVLRRNLRIMILGSTLAALFIINLLLLSIFKQNKQFQKANVDLEAEKTKLQIILKSMGEAAFATDINGHITLFNDAAEKLTGERREEVLGKLYHNVIELILGKDHSSNYTFVEDALTKNIETHVQDHMVLIPKDGKEIPVAINSAPIHDSSGKIAGCVVILRETKSV